jgi:hypothetical protein
MADNDQATAIGTKRTTWLVAVAPLDRQQGVGPLPSDRNLVCAPDSLWSSRAVSSVRRLNHEAEV